MSWIASPTTRRQLMRALADRLDHQGDRARGLVHVRDGERNALAAGSAPHDNELPGAGSPRSAALDDETGTLGRAGPFDYRCILLR